MFAFVAAGMTFLGFMHGEKIGFRSDPGSRFSYVAVGLLLLGSAKFATVSAPAAEPVRHGEELPASAA
jgi:hypothetical protein